jgi:hypothetical protein
MPDGTFTYSNHYKYALKKKLIDESADTIRLLLMRSGFVFNKDNHAQLKNIKTTSGAFTPSFVAATKKITRASGSFITDGFVAGNSITIANSASNNGIKTIDPAVPVTALEMVVLETLVNETGSGDETIVSDDELVTGGGYTQNTKTTGTVTVTEDDTYDRCDSTFPTVTWTASGANIGPTPGLIAYDFTADVIVGYLDFGGAITKAPPDSLNIGNGTLRAA